MATKTQAQTGRFGNITVNNVACNITKWEGTLRKEFADATDSGNYDATTGQVWTSQDPGVVGADASVEGYYDFAGTTDANFTQKFKSDGPFPMALYLSLTTLWANWNWDFSNVKFSVSVPGSTMIGFTADAKSNGAPISLP
jgi:hypothetical protein